MADVAKFLTILLPFGPAIWAFVEGHPLLCAALLFSAMAVMIFFADSKGYFAPRGAPDQKELENYLRGRDPNGKSVDVQVGTVLQQRLLELAAMGKGDPAGNLRWLSSGRRLLSWLYHPKPFHPHALNKAILIAYVYSTVFFVLPWIFGGEGGLGNAVLLPADSPWWVRLLTLGFYALFADLARRIVRPETPRTQRLLFFLVTMVLAGSLMLVLQQLNAGAFAVAVAVAFAVAGAVAVAFAVAGAGAGTVAVAVASAVAGAFAVADAVADAVAVAVAGASVVVGVFGSYYFRVSTRVLASGLKPRLARSCKLWLMLVVLLAVAIAAPKWLPGLGLPLITSPFSSTGEPFVLLFFIGVLPLVNAAFDFVSVGLTQLFFRKIMRNQNNRWWFIVLDLFSAAALVAGLYVFVYAALLLMQRCGWGVDAKPIFKSFVDSPLSVSWLLLLAITNVVPTLIHWANLLSGALQMRVMSQKGFIPGMAQLALDNKLQKYPADPTALAQALRGGSHWVNAAFLLMGLAWAVFVCFHATRAVISWLVR
jgi:hypothetical protein